MSEPPSRQPFSALEDFTIVRYLCRKNGFDNANGNMIWKAMEAANVLPTRTFQSMRNRFLRNIKPRLMQDYGLLLKKYPDVRIPPYLRNQKSTPRPPAPQRECRNDVPHILPPRAALNVAPINLVTPAIRDEEGWVDRSEAQSSSTGQEPNVAYRSFAEECDPEGGETGDGVILNNSLEDKENSRVIADSRNVASQNTEWEVFRDEMFQHQKKQNVPFAPAVENMTKNGERCKKLFTEDDMATQMSVEEPSVSRLRENRETTQKTTENSAKPADIIEITLNDSDDDEDMDECSPSLVHNSMGERISEPASGNPKSREGIRGRRMSILEFRRHPICRLRRAAIIAHKITGLHSKCGKRYKKLLRENAKLWEIVRLHNNSCAGKEQNKDDPTT